MSDLPASYHSGRIRKCGPRRQYVDPVTLRPPIPRDGANLRPSTPPTGSTADIFEEADVTPANVRLAPSSVSFRCRAHVRMWTAYSGNKVTPSKFTYGEVEGADSAHVRCLNLLAFITAHETRIASLEQQIPHRDGAVNRLRKATRGLREDAANTRVERRRRPRRDNTT